MDRPGRARRTMPSATVAAVVLLMMLLMGVCSVQGLEREVAVGPAEWMGDSSSTSVQMTRQAVENKAEEIEYHFSRFFDSLGRLVSARQKWAAAAADDDLLEEEKEHETGKFTVERIFYSPDKRSGYDRGARRCSEPFGYSHPACATTYSCSITEMECSGVRVDPKSYDGDVTQCIVRQVSCLDGPTPTLSASDGCVPYEFECADHRVSAANAPPGAAANCSVIQLLCNASTSVLDFDPNPTSSCHPATSSPSCRSVCGEAGEVCTCSLDRIGRTCASWRPYTCTFHLVSPTPHCKSVPGVDSDPVCFVYKRSQSVAFHYTIDCQFFDANPIITIESTTFNDAFRYFLRTDKFAVSEAQAALWPFQAQLKVFDFKWITDRTATQIMNLTATQLAGNDSVAFTLSFAHIPDRFFAGDRLYFEFGLSRESGVEGKTIKYDRRFVDFDDLHISRTTHGGLGAIRISWIIALSIIGFLVLVVLGYWVRGKLIAWHRPKDHDY